jgi:tetratricopeptide (TPR) repeat protein
MQVQIWRSFSCNNSSDYRLVARFRDPVVATKMRDELTAFFQEYGAEWDAYLEEHDYSIPEDEPLPAAAALAQQHGVTWKAQEILSWGDEGLADNEPDVAVVGTTLAIYHDYCGGFTDNIVRVLTAAGAEVDPEDSCPPDVSVRFTLPEGEAGEQMARELATFFDQKAVHEYMSDLEDPPWGGRRLMGDPSSMFWYRDGQQFGFKMPLTPGSLDDLKAYLANVRDLDLRLCDAVELASFEMRDTLAELDARLAAGEVITELDLTGRRLQLVPSQVLGMTQLRKLVLDENPLDTLPAALAQLTALEELHVASCPLTALPSELARLSNLRVLDISATKLAVLPDVIARLPALRELVAERLPDGVDVSALAGLTALEVLGLGYLRPKGKGVRPFPQEILGLRSLRSLDLSYSALSGIPDEIASLQQLETLHLEAALGHLTALPPLHQLPKLTTLKMNGNAGNTGKYAPHGVLDGVWKITTLHHLGIDRFGEQKGERAALTSLPDDAFARMPHLKTLDLSFNQLVTLPASLYALTELESIDLQYTKLDRPTLDKLRATFPRVKLDLRNVDTKVDVDDPHWKAVHAKVKEGAAKLRDDRAAAVALFEDALAMCRTGAMYSDYDELYASYGCVDALGHLRLAVEGEERERLTDKLVQHATRALELVPAGVIWHYTNEGAFQEEVIRRAGNALAWVLMERGELERALALVDRALSVGGDRGYVFDTKVRILLKLGRTDEAYSIVHTILVEDPAFKDFQDLEASPAYGAWLQTRGTR